MNPPENKNEVIGKFPGGHKWVLRRIRINYGKSTNNQNRETKDYDKQERQQGS
jgi:hypothetical protein